MKRFGFLDKAEAYLKKQVWKWNWFEELEPDPSVETVMKGAAAMEKFKPDWIVAIGGGSQLMLQKQCGLNMNIRILPLKICVGIWNSKLRKKAHFVQFLLPQEQQQK